MVLKIPQLHNFSHTLTKKVLEETGCESVPDWEISVPRRDDIAWSVVLSYLISTNYRNKDDFARRLKQLTGSDNNLKLVKKAIGSFNPFRNRYSCFYNETLKQVVKEFKVNFRWNCLSRVSEKMVKVSTILRCPIVSLWKDDNNIRRRICSKNTEKGQCIIALYSCDSTGEENENGETVYNFLLDHQLGLKMKNSALLYFLREAKMSRKEIRRIESTVKKGKHFLISLLMNNCQDIIPKLYKSAYVVSKLSEAGYETDPRSTNDGGLSALYHALVLDNAKTLYVLYYFAANNCFQSECTYRNPDCCIVNNLLQMEGILLEDFAKSEDFKNYPNYEKLKKTSEDLLGLNKFLIEVNSKIIKIKNKLNYYETTDETVFEAYKRRDILVSVLDTYQEFFKPIQQESGSVSPLDDYVMFKNYYNLIDMATAIIFFDNIIFLKERLVLEDKSQFSAIESSFLFLVMYHVVFDSLNFPKTSEVLHPLFEANVNSLYIFPLIRRLENMNNIKEFSEILQHTTIDKDNVVKLIPRNEIYGILNSSPVFKHSIHLDRLKKYIKTALNVKVIDVKSVLVIERVLQVIGEYITPEENDYSFRRFLSMTLPKEASRILHKIRNELSHLKSYVFKTKVECEANFSLFRSIQKEIRMIKFHFKPVFHTQNLNGCIVLIKLFEDQLEQIRQMEHLYASSPSYPFYLHQEVKTILKLLRRHFFQKYSSSYKEMFETVLLCVEKDISNEINWSEDWENLKTRILYILWPLTWLIEILQQSGEAKIATLFDSIEALKDCNQDTVSINDLKNMTDNLLVKCKDFLSAFIPSRKTKVIKPLKHIKNTDHFLKILKNFFYLSDEERDEIRQAIPEVIKQSVIVKEKIIKSIEEGFSLNLDELSEIKISYLSNKKMDLLVKFYRSKDRSKALAILEAPDPITELEEIFTNNSVDKKKYDALCRTMQFSDQSKKNLGRLVAGQRKKIHGNNLSNLLNRVQLLKKILIEDNDEILNLWVKVKRSTSRRYIVDTIVWYYLRDRELQAAVEMLLFHCMSIYENEKLIENPWIKSSKLYCGINLRNVLSHGSPLLECLCKLLDPEELPSDMIQKILRLIEGEDAIAAILELYERVNNDYPQLLTIVNNGEIDEYIDLKNRILKCDEWKDYALLLPYHHTPRE